MRLTRLLVVLGWALLLAGCEPTLSLHPLFTEKDLVFEPALVGSWAGEEDKTTITFQKAGENAYELFFMGEGTTGKHFEARLAQVGRFLFLDVCPKEVDTKDDFYKKHLVRAHTFYRIKIDGDVLKINYLDDDWVKKMAAERTTNIPQENLDGEIVLTAATDELQNFVLMYAEDTEAFPSVAYRRQK